MLNFFRLQRHVFMALSVLVEAWSMPKASNVDERKLQEELWSLQYETSIYPSYLVAITFTSFNWITRYHFSANDIATQLPQFLNSLKARTNGFKVRSILLNDVERCWLLGWAFTVSTNHQHFWLNKATREAWYSVPGYSRGCYYGYGNGYVIEKPISAQAHTQRCWKRGQTA